MKIKCEKTTILKKNNLKHTERVFFDDSHYIIDTMTAFQVTEQLTY